MNKRRADDDKKVPLAQLQPKKRLRQQLVDVKPWCPIMNDLKFDVKNPKIEDMNALDLFNLATKKPSFEEAARNAYNQRYNDYNELVVILQQKALHDNEVNALRMNAYDTAITVVGQEMSCKYVELFHAAIPYIIIKNYEVENQLCGKLNECILNPTLRTLSVVRMPKSLPISIFDVQRPFVKATKVVINYTDLGEQLSLVSRCCPIVQDLILDSIVVGNFRAQFPRLIYLTISDIENRYTINEVAPLWTLHPNLRQLTIRMISKHPSGTQNGIAMNKLLESIKNHQALISLIVVMKLVKTTITRDQVDRIIREHQKLRRLHLELFRFSVEMVIYLICRLKSIQEFKYHVDNATHKKNLIQQLTRQMGNRWTDLSTDKNFVHLTRQNIKLECKKIAPNGAFKPK